MYASWRKVSRAEHPTAYARTVLVNTYLSHRRRRWSTELPVDATPEPAPVAEDPPLRLDLLSALRTLSPADRTVLVLRYWEDVSVARTAEVLGITENACRTRTSRALARLRTHFPDLED